MPALRHRRLPTTPARVTTVVRADVKTGRLVRASWRRLVFPPPRSFRRPRDKLDIDRIADEQGVESPLVHSVIRAESNYNRERRFPERARRGSCN